MKWPANVSWKQNSHESGVTAKTPITDVAVKYASVTFHVLLEGSGALVHFMANLRYSMRPRHHTASHKPRIPRVSPGHGWVCENATGTNPWISCHNSHTHKAALWRENINSSLNTKNLMVVNLNSHPTCTCRICLVKSLVSLKALGHNVHLMLRRFSWMRMWLVSCDEWPLRDNRPASHWPTLCLCKKAFEQIEHLWFFFPMWILRWVNIAGRPRPFCINKHSAIGNYNVNHILLYGHCGQPQALISGCCNSMWVKNCDLQNMISEQSLHLANTLLGGFTFISDSAGGEMRKSIIIALRKKEDLLVMGSM